MSSGRALVVATVCLAGVTGCGAPHTRIAPRTLALTQAPATRAVDAEDWPRWREGPRGDQVSREAVPGALPPGGLAQRWSADVGVGYASPVAAGGRVYLFSLNGGKETLTAFDADSGAIAWSVEGGAGFTASYGGTRATPAIDGDRIYTYGGKGELTCRSLADGATRWRVDVPAETRASGNLTWGTASSPLVAGDRVYVQGGAGGAIALAVDKLTGKTSWASEATGTGGYAHPILADVGGTAQLIVLGGDAIWGMNPDSGRTLWRHPWHTFYDVNASTPIYRDGRLFVTSEYGHGCAQLAVKPAGPPVVAWQSKAVMSKFQGAVLDGDHLYANSAGTIVCLNWADGAVAWRGTDSKLRLGVGGTITRAGGDKLIALSERGKLSVLRATPGGVQILGQAQLVEGGEVWATPLLYGGRLVVKGVQELVCFELGN